MVEIPKEWRERHDEDFAEERVPAKKESVDQFLDKMDQDRMEWDRLESDFPRTVSDRPGFSDPLADGNANSAAFGVDKNSPELQAFLAKGRADEAEAWEEYEQDIARVAAERKAALVREYIREHFRGA